MTSGVNTRVLIAEKGDTPQRSNSMQSCKLFGGAKGATDPPERLRGRRGRRGGRRVRTVFEGRIGGKGKEGEQAGRRGFGG